MTFIGIDPGKSGALAYFDESGSVSVMAYDPQKYKDALRRLSIRDCFCVLEDVHSMPKQGVASTFAFGHNKGFIEGMLYACGVRYILVAPQRWKKFFRLNKDKKQSILAAKTFFPNVDMRRTDRCKAEHDGIAEALLMAKYAEWMASEGRM